MYNNPGIPDFSITGFNGFANGGTNWYQNDSTNQLSEQISWNHGAHNVMAGFEFSRLATGRAAVNSARGSFTFNGIQTGYAPADFILGTPSSFTTPGPEVRGRVAEWRDGFFVQDKWQISRKFTLSYGLRYELPTVPYTINGVATELNPNADGASGRHAGLPVHLSQPQRLGAARGIRVPHHGEDGVPRGRRHLLQPQPDQQLHVPEHQSALHHHPDLHFHGGTGGAHVDQSAGAGGLPDGAHGRHHR